MTDETKGDGVTLDNGKYTLIRHEDGRMEALRYGEKWRDLTGDNLVAALAERIDHLSRPVSVSDDAYEALELARLALHRSAPIREAIDHLDKNAVANHAKAYQAVLAALEADRAGRGDRPIVTAKQYGSVCNELTHAYMYITERSYGNAQSLIDSSLKQVREWQRLAPQPDAEGGV